MTAENNGEILLAVDAVRDYEYDRGYTAGREACFNELTPRIQGLETELATVEQQYADHMATHAPEETETQRSVAVRVFPQYADKNYGDHARVLAILGDLGIKRISGLLTPGMSQAVLDFYRAAHEQHGIKVWFTVGKPRVALDTAAWTDVTKTLTTLGEIVELVSGWNEPNHIRGGGHAPAGWEKATAAHQAKLSAVAKPLGLDVGTPQLWSGDLAVHDADLKVLAPLVKDTANVTAWHLYPRGDVGANLVARFDTTYKTALGQRPVVCTEAGYFTGSADGTGANPVTEAQQAEYLPAHIKLYTDRGYRISVFELLDDPAGGREGSLGIVRADWTPKPAFGTVKALLAA